MIGHIFVFGSGLCSVPLTGPRANVTATTSRPAQRLHSSPLPLQDYLAEEHESYTRALASPAPSLPLEGPGSLTMLLRVHLRFLHGDIVIASVDGTGAQALAARTAGAAGGGGAEGATPLRVATPATATCGTLEEACERFALWTHEVFPIGACVL